MVTIKRPEEVARMRHAGTILVDVLRVLQGELRPGITTAELDAIAERMIRDAGAIPSFLGYGGSRQTIPFPGSICVSLNDEVVHGITSRGRRVNAGDVVSLDIGCIWQGWHADTARTFAVGTIPDPISRLIDATRRGIDAGIARPFVGHGIGTAMHEDPQVPNYGRPGTGMRIEAGMCFAIEPMFNIGGDDVALLDDGWTVVTADGSISAHFEDTIAVTESGPEVLTRA